MCPACRFEEVLANSPVDAVIDLVGGEYETRSLQVSLRLGSSYCGAQERSPLRVLLDCQPLRSMYPALAPGLCGSGCSTYITEFAGCCWGYRC